MSDLSKAFARKALIPFITVGDPGIDTTEAIERTLGRTQKSIGGVYSDRTMDIDILFYGNDTVALPRLTVPHPLLHERLFVLAPLNEIAPTLLHPQLGKSVQQLLGELKE